MEPVLLAILLADRVITEERTHKKTIVGTFNNFRAQQFPAAFPPWYVYVAFTNVAGEHKLLVDIQSIENDANVYSVGATFNAQEKTVQTEVSLPVLNAAFPEPGKYAVYASIDGQTVGSRILTVSHMKSQGKSG
ncbi:MAG: DUF6941 family protein [Spirochaetota bacterium]